MVSCCSNIFKVPHLTNRCHRERIVQFFLRTFIFVNFIISTVTLSAAVIVRVKLGLPGSCSGLTENIYMSTYTLIAVTVLSYVCMFFTCIKSREVKSSRHLTGHAVIFVIIVVAELFITIMSITQSNRIPDVLRDNAETFASGECLMAVESRFRCCGFRNFTDYPAYITPPGDANKVIFQCNQLNQANGTLLQNTTQMSLIEVFSKSCQCVATKCVTINYTVSFQNVTNDTTSHIWGKNSTINPNSTSVPSVVGTATIHSTACFSKIRSQLKDMYMATGLISILAFVAQLVVFGFHFYLTHNMEGTATVSDIDRPPTQNYAHYIHGKSAKVTFLDLSKVEAESQKEHRGGLTKSESSMSTFKEVMVDVSPRELRVVDGSVIFNDVSLQEFTEFDTYIRLNDVSTKGFNETDRSVRPTDIFFKELGGVEESLRRLDVSSKDLEDVNRSFSSYDVSPEQLKEVDGSVGHSGVAVIQCSKSINITF